MYNGKKILAVIPARGGSKGIPRKNLRYAGGKPLIAWTIESAQQSECIDRIVLSSEDNEIIAVAKEYGVEVPFKRPQELAEDDIPAYLPVIDMAKRLSGYEYTVMLQPPVPLRTAADIDGCIKKCIESNSSSCLSVTEPSKSPYWMYEMENDCRLVQILGDHKTQLLQRQDLKPIYVLNGAVAVAETDWLIRNGKFKSEETIGYGMPQERSLDIDSELDLKFFQYLIEQKLESSE